MMASSTPRIAFALSCLAVGLVLSSCAGAGSSVALRPAGQPTSPGSVLAKFHSPTVDVSPADNSQDVRLDAVVSVRASGGNLDSVAVHPLGTPADVAGNLAPTGASWASSDSLRPDAAYSVDVTAVSPAGDTTTSRTTFHTATAARLTSEMTPGDGATVGVGMPIRLRFNTAIPSALQTALLSHITVETTPAVVGAWHWFSASEVHWRPRDYWPTGTRVNLTANLQGVDAGNGVWGLGNWSQSFTVGVKHVSIIDAAAHQMQVFNNDQLVNTWPVSTGRDGLPTISGTLVVWYKQQDVLMDSQTIGIPRNSRDGYYEHIFWDTAISTDGFFIHAAPWDLAQQGSVNVSHGCVNLSTDRAQTFFGFSQVGDVVVVKNTSRSANSGDGEGDWQLPFDQFANSGGQVAPSPTVGQPGGL